VRRGHVASDRHHVTAAGRGRAGPAAAGRPQGRVRTVVKQGRRARGSTGDSASARISGVMRDRGAHPAMVWRGLWVGGLQAHAIL
jgi:hypothetical protein